MSSPPERATWFGRCLVLAAAALWSTNGFFAKAPLLESWPVETRGQLVAFYRALFGGLALLPWVGRPQWTIKLVPAAACFAAMNYSFIMALGATTTANALWLQYTAPYWVAVVGFLWLGERLTRRDGAMLACGALGIGTILGCEWLYVDADARDAASDATGALWGLAAGLSFAGVIVSLRGLRDQNCFWVIAACQLTAAVVLAPFVVTISPSPGATVLGWFVLFGVVQMAAPYVLFARGLQTLTGSEGSQITLLEPLLAPLWVYLAWGGSPGYRPPATWTWFGGALILIGLVLRYAPSKTADP